MSQADSERYCPQILETSDKIDPDTLALSNQPRGGENLVPLIVDAVEARATVGEVADTLRSEFGEYREEAW